MVEGFLTKLKSLSGSDTEVQGLSEKLHNEK